MTAEERSSSARVIGPRLLSVQAAAEYLSCSDDTVLRLINSGHLSVVRLPVSREHKRVTDSANRRLLVDRVEVDELVTRWREKKNDANETA